MLDVLKFVRGAISSTDSVLPVLTHFCIYKGRIQGANGRIYIDAPCPDLKFEVIVPAERFLRAVDTCKGEPAMNLTEAGRLVLKRESFRAILPTQSIDTFPRGEASSGKRMKVVAGLLEAVKALRPFMATDAERPWASTIYFDAKGGVAYSAANAMIAMVKCKPFQTDVQLPVFAADELVRIGAAPEAWAIDDKGLTFWWGDSWLRTQLIAAEWPTETARRWMEMEAKMVEIPGDLGAQIEALLPFCPDPKYPVIHFKGKVIATAAGESEADTNVGVDLGTGAFHADNLRPMLAYSNAIAITDKVAIFQGKNFKGVMSLLRV